MKILHTSDWHLGKRLGNFSRLDEQRLVMDEICDIANVNNVDAVIIAGDLFDNFNPSSESVELLYKTLKRLSNLGKRPVVAIAGNHDSPDRIEAPDPLAKECGIIFSGYPNSTIQPFEIESGLKITKSDKGFIEISIPECDEPLRILTTPYANEYRLKTYLGDDDNDEELNKLIFNNWKSLAEKHCDNQGVNILATHLFMMKRNTVPEVEPEDEKPIRFVGGLQEIFTDMVPSEINYTALGHLHKNIPLGNNIWYSGSPLAYNFSENSSKKYVMLYDSKTDEVEKIKLTQGKQLLKNSFDTIEHAVAWLKENQEALVELTIESDSFISGKDKKRLTEVHDHIMDIIPIIKSENIVENTQSAVDTSKDIQTIFKEYFNHKYNQDPNEDITNLFKEVLNV